MKISLYALASIFAVASAQMAGPPQCGMNTLISIIGSSGCSITDSECLCKNDRSIKQAQVQIPKSCSATADQQAYATFFNMQCVGKPGFPISMGNVKADGTTTPSASGASKLERAEVLAAAAVGFGIAML